MRRKNRPSTVDVDTWARHWDFWWHHAQSNMVETNARVVFEHWAGLKRLDTPMRNAVWRRWNVDGVRADSYGKGR